MQRHAPRTFPSLIHVTRETHETPAAIEERVTRAGGTNRYGEPQFRVVWGGARLAWIGGRWTDRDASGNMIREAVELRRVPKYLPVDRSPDEWRAQTTEIDGGMRIAALGPYPSRGDYEHCFTLESTAGEFIPLTTAACDWIVRAVEWARQQPRSKVRGAVAAREARRTRDWDRHVDAVLDEEFAATE